MEVVVVQRYRSKAIEKHSFPFFLSIGRKFNVVFELGA